MLELETIKYARLCLNTFILLASFYVIATLLFQSLIVLLQTNQSKPKQGFVWSQSHVK